MSKLNLTLLLLAGVQAVMLAGLWFMNTDRGTADFSEKRLLPIEARDLERVAAIEISAPEARDQKDVRLEKKDKSWVLATSDDFPVRKANGIEGDGTKSDSGVDEALKGDDSAAAGFIKKLAKVFVKRPILKKSANHDAVKVGDKKYERRVTLLDKDKKVVAQVYLSNGPSSRGVYARRAGENEVYESDAIALYDAETESNRWVDTKLCTLKADDVVSAKITLAEKNLAFTLEKKSEPDPAAPAPAGNASAPASMPASAPVKMIDVWYVTAPETLKADKMTVETILRAVTEVNAADVLQKKAPDAGGFDKPTAVVTIRMKDQKEHVFTVGAKRGADSSDYFAKSSESEWYAVVSKWTIDSILELNLEKLKEKPAGAPDAHDHDHGEEH